MSVQNYHRFYASFNRLPGGNTEDMKATLCVSITLGLCWAGVAFVSGCIQGWNDFRSVVWGQ